MSVEAVCDTTPFVNSLSTHLFARRPDVRTSQAIDTLRHEHADAVTELEHRSRTGHAALLAGSGSPNNAPLVGAQHANRPHVYRPPLSSGTIPSQEPHPKLRPRPLADERRLVPLVLPARLWREALEGLSGAISSRPPEAGVSKRPWRACRSARLDCRPVGLFLVGAQHTAIRQTSSADQTRPESAIHLELVIMLRPKRPAIQSRANRTPFPPCPFPAA